MEYIKHITKAIDFIEENLQTDITLAACAKVSGYSQYNFYDFLNMLRVLHLLIIFVKDEFLKLQKR